MADIWIRVEGAAGRITLQRPEALNALTAAMIPQISAALSTWAMDGAVGCVIFDAEGDKAFCAGGDIADLYEAGLRGDYAFGQRFWADEYRLNAQIAEFPKPSYSFLQGFTMGGGVGLGCHCGHRVVGESSKIAMPECGIGLVPDVGGSRILARAPGHLGEYLGLTGARLGPGEAIYAGFADHYLPEAGWDAAKAVLIKGETPSFAPAPEWSFDKEIDAIFSAPSLGDIVTRLDSTESAFADSARKALMRNAPLSMAAALVLIRRVRAGEMDLRGALREEYRFTARATEHGDFVEGIRAAIIDKDRQPKWRHSVTSVTLDEAEAMLAPLDQDLTWEEHT